MLPYCVSIKAGSIYPKNARAWRLVGVIDALLFGALMVRLRLPEGGVNSSRQLGMA